MKTKDMSENVVAKGHCLLACATFQDIAPSPLYARGLIPWNILYRFPIHPKTIGSGRLKAISTLFQNYKFTKLRIEYIPETNSLSNGDVAVWFSQNMDTVYPTEDGFALRSYLEECEDASGCHVWDPMITDPLKEKSTHDVYFTERTSMDLTQIYQTSVAIATSYTDTATKYLGDFVLHYEIELSAPRAPADLFERNSVAGLQFIVTPLTIGMPCICSTIGPSVAFWKNRTGLYYCTTMKSLPAGAPTSYNMFSGLSGRAGEMFYCEVSYHPISSLFANATVTFTYYSNSAAVMQNQPMYAEIDITANNTFDAIGTFILNSQQIVDIQPVQLNAQSGGSKVASSGNQGQPLGIHVIEHESGNFDPHVVVNPFTGNVTCSNPKWRQ